MPYKFKPITPKDPPPIPNIRAVIRTLQNFGSEGWRDLGRYPVPQTSYTRTGKLQKSWLKEGPKTVGNSLVMIVGTNLEYAPFVQGLTNKAPRQLKLFRKLGWLSVTTEGNKLWKKYKPRIQQDLLGK